jgi:hypothetical protein
MVFSAPFAVLKLATILKRAALTVALARPPPASFMFPLADRATPSTCPAPEGSHALTPGIF